jgi:hypothetical protein
MSTEQKPSDFDIDWDINWNTTKEFDVRRKTGDLQGYDFSCVYVYKRTKVERLLYKRYMSDRRYLKALWHRNDASVIMGLVKEKCPDGTVEKLRAEVPY